MLMNIALFGAQGELGALLLKKFLQNGDFVYVYTDTPDALKIDSTANYEIQRGSVSDESAMERTIAKGDAVVVCPDFFAYGKRKDRSTPVADGLEHILNVMKKTGKSRIFLTCAACGGQVGQNAMLRFFNKIVKAFMPHCYREADKVREVISSSGLDYTIFGFINPYLKKSDGGYSVCLDKEKVKAGVSAENLAQCIFDSVQKNAYSMEAPIVYNKKQE